MSATKEQDARINQICRLGEYLVHLGAHIMLHPDSVIDVNIEYVPHINNPLYQSPGKISFEEACNIVITLNKRVG